MALVSDFWLLDFSIIFTPLLLGLYIYMTWTYNYWKDRHVPYAKPTFGLGSLTGLFQRKSHPEIINAIYKQFEGERYCGFFQFRQPMLMIRDPKLIEKILIKDFSYFEDRRLPLDVKNEPLTANLVNLTGRQWRNLRHKLTPTFSSGRLKGMFQQMCNCGDNLLRVIDRYTKTKEVVDSKALVATFSTEVIATCAFGIQIDIEGPDGKKFFEMVKEATGAGSKLGAIRMGLKIFFPELANFFGLRSISLNVHNYFMGIIKATMEHRMKENIQREDFFQLLLALKAQEEAGTPAPKLDRDMIEQDDIQLKYEVKPSPSDDSSLKFTDELVAAQSFVFLAAGSDSVSTTISTVLHYVATHPEVQRQLHAEIDLVLNRYGSWTYQALKEMTYMDQVIQEVQRMFPIAHFHLRACTVPYKIPDSDMIIDKGVFVIIPMYSIQTDPVHFPNPDTFDPSRFDGNNFKPSTTYSPFGDGPRMCIAMRFAVLEMKVCLAKIFSKYHAKPSPKTVTPLRYDPSALSGSVFGGIWLSFQHRES